MTPNIELRTTEEWKYRFTERLGILCGTNEPTDEEKAIAIREADEAMEKLNN